MLCQSYPNHIWPVCYVAPQQALPQVEEFITDCCESYPIRLYRYTGDMRACFELFLKEQPGITAIIVGVRSSDPHCAHLKPHSPTDNGWPAFMRVFPILNWSYAKVWDYLREHHVRYCQLYDQGYTSLGDPSSTIPNPHLRNPDGTYQPAYMLQDESLERAGRLQ